VDVVKELGRLTRLSGSGNADVRTAAVQYLGMQTRLVGYAGSYVVAAIERNTNDEVLIIAGLQSLQDLNYQAASKLLEELMKHPSYSVQKSAMFAGLKDMRLVDEVFELLRKIKLAKGESWDGVSVNYDTGASGTHDQEMAEKIGREQQAKNERKGRGGARSQRDLSPVVEEVLKELTGEVFESEKAGREWFKTNEKPIAEAQAALDALGAQQLEDAKDAR
jgi:hypothetical protein